MSPTSQPLQCTRQLLLRMSRSPYRHPATLEWCCFAVCRRCNLHFTPSLCQVLKTTRPQTWSASLRSSRARPPTDSQRRCSRPPPHAAGLCGTIVAQSRATSSMKWTTLWCFRQPFNLSGQCLQWFVLPSHSHALAPVTLHAQALQAPTFASRCRSATPKYEVPPCAPKPPPIPLPQVLAHISLMRPGDSPSAPAAPGRAQAPSLIHVPGPRASASAPLRFASESDAAVDPAPRARPHCI